MAVTRLLIEKACYHIFSRGNQQQKIFLQKEDFLFYLLQLKRYKRKYQFLLYGYCLMPNHVHLIGESIKPKNIPKLMQCLQRSYTAYFNKKYHKVGHLWQGRFKMKAITKDEYLINCIAYIEQNPLRSNLISNITGYEFSSYEERTLGNNACRILDKLSL